MQDTSGRYFSQDTLYQNNLINDFNSIFTQYWLISTRWAFHRQAVLKVIFEYQNAVGRKKITNLITVTILRPIPVAVGLRRIVVSVYVCLAISLFVCLLAYLKNITSKCHQMFDMLPVAVARPFFDGNAMCYVLPPFYGWRHVMQRFIHRLQLSLRFHDTRFQTASHVRTA